MSHFETSYTLSPLNAHWMFYKDIIYMLFYAENSQDTNYTNTHTEVYCMQ
jgi:hypothetical protein